MMKYISICTAAVAAAFFACVQTVNAQTALSTQQSLKVSFKYKLRPLDLLEIRVFQEPDLQKTVRVAADGTIDLPLIGRLEVKGLTIQESQEKIRALYDKDYIVNPQVSVFILEYSPQRVHVIGQVNRNGEVRFPPEERMTLSKAIADAVLIPSLAIAQSALGVAASFAQGGPVGFAAGLIISATAISSALSAASGIVSSANALDSVKSNPPTVPQFAFGTTGYIIPDGGSAIVGEMGAEIVSNKSGKISVQSNAQLQEQGFPKGDIWNVTINVEQALNPDEVYRLMNSYKARNSQMYTR